jgi:radical SAM superfamily enzyme YgiQ (UPF0313 family)
MIHPQFASDTFWSFEGACEFFGARYPAPPLGLITVAAMLPSSWNVRLVDRNIEDLTDSSLEWADVVLIGGMLPQIYDMLHLIELCHKHGKPIVIGGPAVSSSPELFEKADFRILGEAEDIIAEFIAAWDAGKRQGTFEAKKFEIDVTKTPAPRFDLLKLDSYLYVGVQYSRGCPFTCEFCDIIELYGRVPRTKTTPQMLSELTALYELGYRGHVDFVDDNLIGNKKAVKAFLPALKSWLEEHDYPFEFTTEASINLADDAELLRLMNEANFVGVFVGIESPDPATLILTKKKQNTRRNIAQSIHKLYASGLYVTAGFILGFDSEKSSIADAMVELIEDAAIPVCMVGLLTALPKTQLTRRLDSEGRLRPLIEGPHSGSADQCTKGLNFETIRPRRDILLDYKNVLERVYSPQAFIGRLRRLAGMLDNSTRKRTSKAENPRHKMGTLESIHHLVRNLPEPRDAFWQTFMECARSNPRSVRYIVMLMALYLHLGPFSRFIVGQIDQKIADSEEVDYVPLARTPGTVQTMLN